MAFCEVGRTSGLFRSSFRLESDEYSVVITYMGNYEEDRRNHDVKPELLFVKINPKDKNLNLKAYKDTVFIQDIELQSIPPQFAKNITNQIKIAADAAMELQEIIRSYL